VVVAALAALVLGILALVDVRRGAGKVKGTGRAIAGMVAATLVVSALVLAHGVVAPAAARAVRKIESSNNLKVLGLAMHYYHDRHKRLPSAVLRDRGLGDRAQPYSWRVALLPILGEDKLFSQYRRDEPWDSPANKAVLARMPRVFAPPDNGRAAASLTYYQVFVGPGTAFESSEVPGTLREAFFPRGLEQTILVVEAAEPVPWTKPEDLSYAPNGPLPRVGGLVGNGFHALFADGSVRWFDQDQAETTLRTLVPRNGR
jgi:prepilin-type processing-associated H-X9-DG protein